MAYKFEPGEIFYKYVDGAQGERKCYVINRFIDKGHWLVVYRWYGKHKQWWHYAVEYRWVLNLKHAVIIKKKGKG